MLQAIAERYYVPLSLADLVDPDYLALAKDGLVESYNGIGASIRCHLTDKGRDVLAHQPHNQTHRQHADAIPAPSEPA